MTDKLKPNVLMGGPRPAPLPTDFNPPEGWTFMARTFQEVLVASGIAEDDPALYSVALVFQGLRKGAVARCYVYPTMLLTMVWSPENAMWIGSAVGRT